MVQTIGRFDSAKKLLLKFFISLVGGMITAICLKMFFKKKIAFYTFGRKTQNIIVSIVPDSGASWGEVLDVRHC